MDTISTETRTLSPSSKRSDVSVGADEDRALREKLRFWNELPAMCFCLQFLCVRVCRSDRGHHAALHFSHRLISVVAARITPRARFAGRSDDSQQLAVHDESRVLGQLIV